jgi:hypothetical protein
MSSKSFVPKNIVDMTRARDVNTNIFENISSMPSDFEMYPFTLASYVSLCLGCTDPNALNFNPLAEVDDSTCL